MRKGIYILAIFLILTLYFSLRFTFLDTIEFAYDQPKLTNIVLDFLNNGKYLTSQNYTQDTIGGTVAWGPSLVYFFAPFLLISKDPIVASLMMAGFNLLSIVFVFLIGWEFFSPKVGVLGAIVLATHPWWVIFSRMIYQPTPIPTFIALSTYCLFRTFDKPKSLWLGITIFTWGILLQMYLLTFSFILTSLVFVIFLLIKKRQFPVKQIIFGGILNLIIYFPSFIYYVENWELLKRFYEVKNMYVVVFSDLLKNFFFIVSGGGLEWQLGYAYKSFLSQINVSDSLFLVSGILVFLFVGYYMVYIAKKNIYSLFLLAVLAAPIWAIPFVGVENIVPRYFLYILPAMSLILAVSTENIFAKFGAFVYVPMGAILVFWIFIMVNYFVFIKNYDYPNGFLSHYSDVPYSFAVESVNWVMVDAKMRGNPKFYISSESLAVDYHIDKLVKSNGRYTEGLSYEVSFGRPDQGKSVSARFGPLTIYRTN